MKINNLFIAGLTLIAGNQLVSAQNTEVRAVKWNTSNPSVAEIVTLNPDDANSSTLINRLDLGTGRAYIPNSMTYVQEDNSMFFFTQSAHFSNDLRFGSFSAQQRLLLANATTGKIEREIPFPNTTLVSPFVISEEAQVGFISSEQSHNGYGNNDNNVALVIFDLRTGEVAHKINLPSLSFGGVSAPFYGKLNTQSLNGFGTIGETMMSISSPCYNGATQRLYFAGRDVMGINRMYVFNLSNGTLVSQSQLSENILDMVFDYDRNVIKALYVEDTEGERVLRVGEFDITSNTIINSTIVRTITADEKVVSDGAIELDAATGSVYVVKSVNDIQHVYTFDAELNLIAEETGAKEEKVDFEFKAPIKSSAAVAFDNLVKIYPNPAVDEVTIETIPLTKTTRIRVLNNVGQEVKDVLVQSQALSNTINISNLTTGIYMVEIHSDGAEVMYEKLIIE